MPDETTDLARAAYVAAREAAHTEVIVWANAHGLLTLGASGRGVYVKRPGADLWPHEVNLSAQAWRVIASIATCNLPGIGPHAAVWIAWAAALPEASQQTTELHNAEHDQANHSDHDTKQERESERLPAV